MSGAALRQFRRIDARIARLPLNAASSIALFLIETWERKERRVLPQDGAVATHGGASAEPS